MNLPGIQRKTHRVAGGFFTYDELMARDKVNLDIFWLRDESLEETANLPDPDTIIQEIVEDLEAVLEQLRGILENNNIGDR